jgi:mRNA interferase MazF
MVSPRRFEVWLVSLDPATGTEIKKTRPCVIVSPDEMNRHLRTAIVAPLTSTLRNYPMRVRLKFQGKEGEIALDQLRAVDRERLAKRLGSVDPETSRAIAATLVEMFD